MGGELVKLPRPSPNRGEGATGRIYPVSDRARIPVAREGWPFILAPAVLAEILALAGWVVPAMAAFALAAFCTYFFRDPERIFDQAPEVSEPVVCPADGKIIFVGQVEASPLAGRPALKVSIFMNVFDVHVNRSPVRARVAGIKYVPGRFFNAALEKASAGNERLLMTLQTPAGQVVEVVQVAGLIARRIVSWVRLGDDLLPGERFGLIRFGSRVDLYLPLETSLLVGRGQRVKAGQTLIGRLP